MQFFLFENPGSQLFNYLNTVAFTFLKVSTLIEQTLVKVILCFYPIDDARSHRAILIQVLSLVHFGVFSFQNKLKKKDETSNKKIHLPFSKPRNCQKEVKIYHSFSRSRLCDVYKHQEFPASGF